MTTHQQDHRTLPRRRGAELVAAILAAALAELTEQGYAGLSMESVAKRAGASKASLYRRWDSRAALVMDAVYTQSPSAKDFVDTGALRTDLLALLTQTVQTLRGPAGEAMRGMLADALPDARRSVALRARSQGRNRGLMERVLARGIERGEIPDGASTPARLEVGAALVRNHFLFHTGPLDTALLTTFVDEVLLPLFGTIPQEAPKNSA
ncbi:TetR family transcriptional regulator [Arthrobacter sp. MYb227]|uniref:TetR/AcrR family transcriptional regulator n=1 Tax=Arthrobacter sp. MYb227 TaxID=1848601 RepID=UPI000CFB3DEB|nr:TetR/AcrR family transcriptional regulator [Arthrobacter sp. MYb227]PQZ93025.1 TetR family transcriptional regulator [Arthrobacter sp. MYb227]